jgi:shikimate 5-dehydrogenase
MTYDESSPNGTNLSPEFPFAKEKIPVAEGVEAFKTFIGEYPDFAICPYVAYKDTEGWDKSTSRVYMNQVLPNFLYVPVNIPKGDAEQLRQFFEYIGDMERVPAVNITQPHKSNPVVRELLLGDAASDENIDTLIRDSEGKLVPYNLNAPAFVGWFNEEVGSFADRQVTLIGVGGVGEPIAKGIAAQHPSRLILIDPVDKSELAQRLSAQAPTEYHQALSEAHDELPENAIVINAAGKEGASESSALNELLGSQASSDKIFVDIRPHLDIEEVERAKRLGWRAFTGHGMNARNDYELLVGITDYLHTTPPPFARFQELVARAS